MSEKINGEVYDCGKNIFIQVVVTVVSALILAFLDKSHSK